MALRPLSFTGVEFKLRSKWQLHYLSQTKQPPLVWTTSPDKERNSKGVICARGTPLGRVNGAPKLDSSSDTRIRRPRRECRGHVLPWFWSPNANQVIPRATRSFNLILPA
ncbi:hypothetical protein CC1G_07208 [Coprinopsis cinerea okayama7|uniref:Uncharacterized protein n=1 Tax=Coprinopsis cinerea (strain Okayama-7 / 130 / ATCC MYA-4618 / FGSC 9003) TaxID=240176 RepID=A8PCW7_COPC7|nr:hypothetical protein CC1G_07208 [Coprinopsis cinerea okayama7\|eukprot:XP_001840478.2 hypothetical protein CC1G_07208 [Coprinopsis cinerea okayama7\